MNIGYFIDLLIEIGYSYSQAGFELLIFLLPLPKEHWFILFKKIFFGNCIHAYIDYSAFHHPFPLSSHLSSIETLLSIKSLSTFMSFVFFL